MTPKNFPVQLVIFSGPQRGKIVATFWVPFAGDWFEHAEDKAERMANEWNAEVDILTGSVMPSGKVGSYERAGIRCRPLTAA